MRKIFAALCVVWVSTTAAHAQAQLSIAMDQLRIGELIDVMRVEGLDYAQTLNTEMLSGQGGAVWAEQVDGIYNGQRMTEQVREGLAALSDEHLREINRFYGSDLGRKVIGLEIAGRRAMMQDDLSDIAQDAYQVTLEEDPESLEAIHTIDRVGDMVERNVTAALTANYRFYLGLVDGRAFALSEEEILTEAWAQEEAVRIDTLNWLMGYLLLSYQPLDEHEMTQLVTFVQTPAGRALNAAIFEGFGEMYADISYALGRAVALNMVASEL